jgi:hypothetical protein
LETSEDKHIFNDPRIDPAKVVKDVQVATDAMIVNVTYQSRGYALLRF